MAGELSKEYADIKAGVSGIIGDVPSPSSSQSEEYDNPPQIPQTEYTSADGSDLERFTQPSFDTSFSSRAPPSLQGMIPQERLHELVEAVVNEKFDDFMGNVGNIAMWKEQMNTNLLSVKQEIIRIEERFGQLQQAVLGKVKSYDETMKGVQTEMKALEKVFEKILEPLVANVRELGKITEELKKIQR